jgi:ubiquinone/menaquinone biosynthesis C-methylase UbiE
MPETLQSLALNDEVRAFWERQPCGTDPRLVGRHEPMTRPWFEAIERYRYETEPMIHAVAQFTRYHGQRLLEVGVGAGTDHLQWARAGAICFGVDLTDAAIETTRAHLAAYGLSSDLRRVDAETLPFPDDSFDVVYSWGVIHHTERPERIIAEIRRVLRPGGVFIGMMYGRHSIAALKVWARQALARGRPWRSLSDVLWHHVESVGTKAYRVRELEALFADFSHVTATPIKTIYDTHRLPRWLAATLPDAFGWFVGLRATK